MEAASGPDGSPLQYLLPSIVRTVECGFRYIFVLGYDRGDRFYDSESGHAQISAWFDTHVRTVLAHREIEISLRLVQVNNHLSKPGPVFNAMSREASVAGADRCPAGLKQIGVRP